MEDSLSWNVYSKKLCPLRAIIVKPVSLWRKTWWRLDKSNQGLYRGTRIGNLAKGEIQKKTFEGSAGEMEDAYPIGETVFGC